MSAIMGKPPGELAPMGRKERRVKMRESKRDIIYIFVHPKLQSGEIKLVHHTKDVMDEAEGCQSYADRILRAYDVEQAGIGECVE